MKTKFVTTLCLPLAALLVLAGCGGGGSKANASASNTTGGANADRSAFTKCLSDHGVTLPSGGFPGGGNGGPPRTARSRTSAPATVQGTPPRGSFPGGDRFEVPRGVERVPFATAEWRTAAVSGRANSQAFQAYTSCLRDHGVSVPTTTAGGSATPGSRPNFQSDPKFASANKTCRALLPTNNNTTTTTSGS